MFCWQPICFYCGKVVAFSHKFYRAFGPFHCISSSILITSNIKEQNEIVYKPVLIIVYCIMSVDDQILKERV